MCSITEDYRTLGTLKCLLDVKLSVLERQQNVKGSIEAKWIEEFQREFGFKPGFGNRNYE